jgi:hypothetical protein
MPKNKVILFIIIFAGIAAAAGAQVDRDELQQTLPQVIFINYEGPHARIDTREQIRQLGVVLGRQISAGEGNMAATRVSLSTEERRAQTYKLEVGALSRYFVIHCVSAPEDTKIDADVFGLGVDTGVDHVRNLRSIIQGYLQEAYNYNASDAAILAEYITIYNAVYRGNWDYFTGRFKNQVISNLTREKAGLSIRYDEWPGRTLMLIPLGFGGLNAIDTTAIADRRVVEELRREDDRGVPQRQGMVDLMERQAEQAEQTAQAERQGIRQEERAIAQERQQTAQDRQQTAQERQQVQEDRQEGRITEEEAAQAEQELDERDQVADAKDEELDNREAALDDRRQEAQRLEDFAEQKTDQAQQERQQIAQDQQAAIAGDTQGGVFGIAITKDSPTTMGRIVRLGLDGREQRRSPLDTVHVRTVTMLGGRILAVAGEFVGNGAARLVEINQSTLEMAKQGDDDIQIGTLLWVNGNDLYAITLDRGSNQCYLGRFDTNLSLQAKSTVKVHTSAGVTIQQGRLLTQRDDGSALLLNPVDLTEAK